MQAERITSAQNPLLRHIRKLQTSRAYREECGEFVADGWKLLSEVLKWYPFLTNVIVTDRKSSPELPEGVRIVEIPESLMQSLSSMKTPQGVIFTCRLPQNRDENICAGSLLLDRIQDPGNLGTILRTADAFSIPVFLTNGCADPFSEKTIRASMGAVFRTLPQYIPLQEILRKKLPLAATALSSASVDLREVDLRNYVVVIGSEGQGISNELLAAAEKHVIIPMQERCESLNAGVAAAIAMWQMIK
ncbi:MAG: RNA methyltransferase [Ruminococcaceae bacterium]|nr:RNA methyltransferase [Oscillospiraceae bacterium]